MYQTLCVSLYESISEQLWHRDLETASNSVYSPSATMALILYLCLQVMHLTESMCPCVFSSILLFLCLCAFLYFFPLVLDMFLSLWTSLTPSPCVTASVYIALCSCQCMNFYIWLGLRVPMQANFEMTISVYVLALPRVSPSLCVFFFALSVPVFVCLFMCTF